MPSSTERQRKFMWVVHGIQKGKISPGDAGEKATKAAQQMKSSDVKDFLMQECGLKECGKDAKIRLLKALKEVSGAGPSEPMNLEAYEEEPKRNVISSTKTLHGDYEKTLKMYRGIQFTPKEAQAIQNFTDAKPTKLDKFFVKYDKVDDFGNNTDITVKKLQEGGKFIYVAFVKNRPGEEETPEEPEAGPAGGAPQEPNEEEIMIIKSSPIDDQEGSEILTNFLMDVYHK
jgi:hypothetical protein